MFEGIIQWVSKRRFGRRGSAVRPAVDSLPRDAGERRSREDLERSERHYRLLVEASLDMTSVIAPTGEILYLSPAAEAGLGYSASELVGRNAFDFIHPDDYEQVVQTVAAAYETPHATGGAAYRFRHADGTWRWYESIGRDMREEPTIGGLLISSRDVTEIKNAEQRQARLTHDLNERVKEVRTLHEATKILQSAESTEQELLSRVAAIVPAGWQVPEITAARIRFGNVEATSPAFRETPWMLCADFAVADGTRGTVEVAYLEERPPADIGPFLTEERALIDSLGEILGTYLDRKRALADLVRTRDEALEASRVKSAFLANISHEIRTPLNVILGYHDLVAEHLRDIDDSSQDEAFEIIVRSGRRLLDTIRKILDMSRIAARAFDLRPELVHLDRLVSERLAALEADAREQGVELRFDDAGAVPAVRVDEYCVKNALANLLDNAIKFSEGGVVTVALREDAAGGVRLDVQDEGVGMSREYLERLFEPFSQEEQGYTRRFEGTGLGLAVTRHYLELNGASIDAVSRKGEGSTFSIHFPAALVVDESKGRSIA